MFRWGSQRGSPGPPGPLQPADLDLADRRNRPSWMPALLMPAMRGNQPAAPAVARAAAPRAAMRLAPGGRACISLGVSSVGGLNH